MQVAGLVLFVGLFVCRRPSDRPTQPPFRPQIQALVLVHALPKPLGVSQLVSQKNVARLIAGRYARQYVNLFPLPSIFCVQTLHLSVSSETCVSWVTCLLSAARPNKRLDAVVKTGTKCRKQLAQSSSFTHSSDD